MSAVAIRKGRLVDRTRVATVLRSLGCTGVVWWCVIGLTAPADAQTVTSEITYTYGDEIPGQHTYSVGRLALVEEREGGTTVVRSASFDYDVRGNITRTNRVLDGATYTTDQTYDSLNRVETVTYPDTPTRETVTNAYDFAGNLRTVTGVDGAVTTNYVTDIQYDAFGKRTRITFGNGTQTDFTYDSDAFRLQQLRTLGPGGTLQDLNYTYDAVGNVLTIRDGLSAGYNESFDYDDLHRLTGAFGAYGSLTYSYDQIGNMTCNSQVSPCSATSPNYAYPPSGLLSVRPHAVNQAGPYTYTYDANGNMASRSTSAGIDRSLTYDVNNRPTSMTVGGSTVTFAYDYTGERVRKQAGGTTTTYIGGRYECTSSCTKYIFAGDTRVALKTLGGDVRYFLGNHLGSTHVVTDSAGAQVEEIHYYPYGVTYSDSDGEVQGASYRYTGQHLDVETSLYYYHARYYDPLLGRFVSGDVTGVFFENPQTLNRYSYALNNPLKNIDPTGRYCQTEARDGGSTVCISDGQLTVTPGPSAPPEVQDKIFYWNPNRDSPANGWSNPLDVAQAMADSWRPSWQQPVARGPSIPCEGCNVFGRFSQDLRATRSGPQTTVYTDKNVREQVGFGPIETEHSVSYGYQFGDPNSWFSYTDKPGSRTLGVSVGGWGATFWPFSVQGPIGASSFSFTPVPFSLQFSTTNTTSGYPRFVTQDSWTLNARPFFEGTQSVFSNSAPSSTMWMMMAPPGPANPAFVLP